MVRSLGSMYEIGGLGASVVDVPKERIGICQLRLLEMMLFIVARGDMCRMYWFCFFVCNLRVLI